MSVSPLTKSIQPRHKLRHDRLTTPLRLVKRRDPLAQLIRRRTRRQLVEPSRDPLDLRRDLMVAARDTLLQTRPKTLNQTRQRLELFPRVLPLRSLGGSDRVEMSVSPLTKSIQPRHKLRHDRLTTPLRLVKRRDPLAQLIRRRPRRQLVEPSRDPLDLRRDLMVAARDTLLQTRPKTLNQTRQRLELFPRVLPLRSLGGSDRVEMSVSPLTKSIQPRHKLRHDRLTTPLRLVKRRDPLAQLIRRRPRRQLVEPSRDPLDLRRDLMVAARDTLLQTRPKTLNQTRQRLELFPRVLPLRSLGGSDRVEMSVSPLTKSIQPRHKLRHDRLTTPLRLVKRRDPLAQLIRRRPRRQLVEPSRDPLDLRRDLMVAARDTLLQTRPKTLNQTRQRLELFPRVLPLRSLGGSDRVEMSVSPLTKSIQPRHELRHDRLTTPLRLVKRRDPLAQLIRRRPRRQLVEPSRDPLDLRRDLMVAARDTLLQTRPKTLNQTRQRLELFPRVLPLRSLGGSDRVEMSVSPLTKSIQPRHELRHDRLTTPLRLVKRRDPLAQLIRRRRRRQLVRRHLRLRSLAGCGRYPRASKLGRR